MSNQISVRKTVGISKNRWKKSSLAERMAWKDKAEAYQSKKKEETMNTVDCCDVQCMPVPKLLLGHIQMATAAFNMGCCKEEEKVNAMDTNTETSNQRRYLRNRLDDMAYAKKNDLKKAFGLVEDTPPKDAAEVVKRIQDGKFSLDEKAIEIIREQFGYVPHIFTGLKWQDPSVTPDKAGYEAAKDKVAADVVATTDIIAIKSPEDGLAALQEFEAKTYH